MKKQFLSTLIILCMSTTVTSQKIGKIDIKSFMEIFKISSDYQFCMAKKVSLDNKKATWTRYQKTEKMALGGEHFSFVISENGIFKGFVWLDESLTKGELPNEKQAEKIADEFLKEFAPDLSQSKELHWIKPHDESITINGKSHIVSGMKVKMRNPKTGLWFWVIVGKNGQPIVFERDIVWLNFQFRRQTEKWLHDDWVKEQK